GTGEEDANTLMRGIRHHSTMTRATGRTPPLHPVSNALAGVVDHFAVVVDSVGGRSVSAAVVVRPSAERLPPPNRWMGRPVGPTSGPAATRIHRMQERRPPDGVLACGGPKGI